jgi:hypothetical protein
MTFAKALRAPFEHLFKRPPAAPPPPPAGAGVDDWAPECRAFLDYWMSLRDGRPVPTSARFLDDSSPRFAGVTYIIEILDGAPVVRLQGLKLEQAWSRDLTGQDFFPGRSAQFRAAAAANMKHVLEHPCGHLVRTTYASSKGRKISSDWIQLPLAVREGRAPRIVGAVFEHGARNFAETTTHHFELHKLGWLDAGCGVPSEPPTPLTDA